MAIPSSQTVSLGWRLLRIDNNFGWRAPGTLSGCAPAATRASSARMMGIVEHCLINLAHAAVLRTLRASALGMMRGRGRERLVLSIGTSRSIYGVLHRRLPQGDGRPADISGTLQDRRNAARSDDGKAAEARTAMPVFWYTTAEFFQGTSGFAAVASPCAPATLALVCQRWSFYRHRQGF
jgi:hypothetical protein